MLTARSYLTVSDRICVRRNIASSDHFIVIDNVIQEHRIPKHANRKCIEFRGSVIVKFKIVCTKEVLSIKMLSFFGE